MNTPIPHDIPLPLPAPEGFLEILLIISFIAHIVFVHLMVGSSMFSLVCQLKGLKIPDYDRIAYYIARTITVNKSLAVVMGVAPLLLINTLYAPQFYASSALIGDAWMAVIPLVTIAFVIAYTHKFWWQRFSGLSALHIGIAALETLIFLAVPLIFLTNVNLMLMPERWYEVKGFFSALLLPNVLPRYLHFLAAAVLLTSLFLVWLTGRRAFVEQGLLTTLSVLDLRRYFYSIALGAVIVQVLTGLIVLVTLPTSGMSWSVVLMLLFGGGAAVPAIRWMWQDLHHTGHNPFKHFHKMVWLFAGIVLVMAIGRHSYRNNALAWQQAAIALKTADYRAAALQAKQDAESIAAESLGGAAKPPGETDFEQFCGACHHPELVTVGPSLQEIRSIYANDPEGIVKWTRTPGKKRPESMQMPGFRQLTEDRLQTIARYILAP